MNPTSNEPGLQDELRSDARELGNKTKDRIHSELDARKSTASTQAKSLSSAIDRAAGGLDDDSPEWLRSALQQGARKVQRFADTLEQKDSREILAEVSTFARQNPTTFLAACAAAGFAAARLFKAGDPQSANGSAQYNQGPPPRVDEPMIRPSPAGQSHQPAGGEFV